MDAWLCRQGFESAVARALSRAGGVVEESGRACVVTATLTGVDPDPAFASQRLPDVSVVSEVAIPPGSVALHVVVPELDEPGGLVARAKTLDKELRAKHRFVPFDPAPPGGTTLLQVVVVSRHETLVSCSVPRTHASGIGFDPFWEPLGRAHVKDDREAPSSAFRKAEEGFRLLGLAPSSGERVADVGAAPGGWSWTALKRGAHVIAVDRGKLEDPVKGHPACQHVRKDAFEWEPPHAMDWLFCDVITDPEKTIGLLDRWLEKKWCKRFVVNVKFKPGSDYGQVAKLRAVLARRGVVRARVKQLGADKNEVTAVGTC
jgi:23S rRNA C2498 (ribose-2'-O)-methylase RlmM